MDILVIIAMIIHLNNLELSPDLDYSTEARVCVQLRFKYGDHKYHSVDVVASDLYDKRVTVNVLYNLDAGKLSVLFVHVEKFLANGRANYHFHVKFTVHQPLRDQNIELQKPYDKPLYDRYSYDDGVRSLWVFSNDKPFKPDSGTRPRTEARIKRCGKTLQLRIYDGDMKYYKFDVVATDMCDKWFRLNVIHNADEGKVTVFIDGVQKFVVNDRGPGDHYFKFGAYAPLANSSNHMESRWKEIKIYKK
ncbi:hypothetical protein RJ639_045121 [Escallonia herrerae]|uniref:Alginate lyase 2 domain-containing protein n=1 Tax=Escallonia herrerae TaxID=1293975 RepID=A0AA88W7W8_9ASTE|nr:hypothetical protein RJ639_045121 [Escallonia herrerae]